MSEIFEDTGFGAADTLLPKNVDMIKWAVVACDQFTSQPEYWQAVADYVGDAPSTLHLVLPEAQLGADDVEQRIEQINSTMENYLSDGVFEELSSSLIYIERTQSDGKVRHGIIGVIDLECYDFTPGSGALIRATEGTVLSRIPPRVKVRKNAPIELPHVMLLIDDPQHTVIEPVGACVRQMQKLYDFDLQQDGGHIAGYQLSEEQTHGVASALQALATSEEMGRKYGMPDAEPLLFAVGDGNHSLATAKRCYEDLKAVTPQDQWASLPARYALVEVVNNHDDALQFEPIHRVLFGVQPREVLDALQKYYPQAYEGEGEGHTIRYVYEGAQGAITVPNPQMQLAVGTLQQFLDEYVQNTGVEIDYIHGDDTVCQLSKQQGNIGFMLPAMGKEQLFKTVMADGVLPRKTFSMGHAQDKRYYIEARKIR